jgi:hypothetical protein
MDPQKGEGAAPKAANTSRASGETLRAGSTAVPGGAATIPARIGKFAVQRLLGSGAFGSVYLATDTDLGRQVAIKVPRAEGLTPATRDRFLREARASATIHHPNVCPVHDVGVQGEVPYIVMHYVPGGTLEGYLDRQGVLPPTQAVALAQKLALGVAAAHEHGVVHRDLKPQNVLFDPAKMLAVITDFGLAITGDEGRAADGSVAGTPAYMSPEQAKGKVSAVGPLSDVYSLGVILFRMLTGVVPFEGPVRAVLAAHVVAPVPTPSAVRPGLDKRLDAIVLKAMAKSPADRYPSAKAFADALAGYASGEPRPVPIAPAAPPAVVPPGAPPVAVVPVPIAPPAVPKAARPAPPPLPPPAPIPEPAAGVRPTAARRKTKKRGSRVWLLVGGAAAVVLTVAAGALVLRFAKSSANRTPVSAKSDEPAKLVPVSQPPRVTPPVTAPKIEPKAEPKVEPKKVEPKPPEPAAVPEASKQAVKDGLDWLARQQMADGGWEFDVAPPYKAERAAATGLAVRPFIWARAVRTARDDAQDRVITRGLGYLARLSQRGKMSDNMYAQGIAAIALCEGYGATRDVDIKPFAQAAVDHIESAQGPNGSWGYTAGTNGDTSIVGWQLQALDAAKAAGLTVSDAVVRRAVAFLDTVAVGPRKSVYGYASNTNAKAGTALSAIGLYARCRLDGWDATTPGLADGVAGLATKRPRGFGELRDLYYYFYATRVVRLYGGDEWQTWAEGPKGADGTRSGGMRDWLLGTRAGGGASAGSWPPEDGFFGTHCGRVGTTAAAVLILQLCNGDR